MIRLSGAGLHGGATATVVLAREEGPTTFGRGDDRAPIGALRVVGVDRCSTALLPSGREVRVVEHLFAAIAGANAFDGVRVEVDGDELPLLDGGCARYFDAIAALEPPPPVRVARVVRASRHEAFGTTLVLDPGDHGDVVVAVDYPEGRFGRALAGEARWTGDRSSFRERIATARTFGAARELEALRARGLAAHVPSDAVVALDLDERGPRDPEEPLRHKLLDAIGDLAALGAPLVGRVRVDRPSHRGTRACVDAALASGSLVVEARNPEALWVDLPS